MDVWDDLNPTVMTAQLGFGEVFGRTEEGVSGCREVRWFDKRETKTRLVSERSTNTAERSEERQLQADASF